MEPLSHLPDLELYLSSTGPALSIISSLRYQFPSDPVINSLVWYSLHSETESQRRNAQPSGWSALDEVSSDDDPYARAAITCLDVLNSFVNATPQPEKIHISAFLSIKDLQDGQQDTSGGSSLTIQKPSWVESDQPAQPGSSTSSVESLPQPAYNDAAALIVSLKDLKELFKESNEDPDFSATIVVDINVMEDLRFERTTQDNREVIALAIITGHILLRLVVIEADGSFIKVQPQSALNASDEPNGKMLISARWPDNPPSVLKMADNLRLSWTGQSKDFLKLRDVVDNITDRDGRRNIIILGRTGSGKSYTGNWILRQICGEDSEQFLESESGSMTSFVENLPKQGNFSVWDTPGLDDAYGRDQRYLDDIEKSILEMGTVSVIIMCFASIERIERSVQQQIASYAKIVGPDLSSRMMLFVNRQSRGITSFQKKNMIKAMLKEGNLTVKQEQIFDMRTNAQDLQQNWHKACQMLLKLCGTPGMKMSYVDRLQQGLLQIQKLADSEMKKTAEDVLVRMSSELLWHKFGSKNRVRPLTLLASTGNSIVLSDRSRYTVKDEKVMIEHVLELPKNARTTFNRLTIFVHGFGSRDRHVLRLVELVRKLRLVFMEMPSDRRFDKGGLVRKVLRIRYKLWNVSDALSEDVKQHIQKATGLAGETCVSSFHC